MYKVIVSPKKESNLNHWKESFFKTNPKPFHIDVNVKYWHIAHPLVAHADLGNLTNSWKHFWNVWNAFDKYCMLFTSCVIRVSKHRERITIGSRKCPTSQLRFQFRPQLQAATLSDSSVWRCMKSNTPHRIVRDVYNLHFTKNFTYLWFSPLEI